MKEFSVAYQPKTYSDFIAAAYAKYLEYLGYELPGSQGDQGMRGPPEPLLGPPEQVAATVKVVEVTTELIPKPPKKLAVPKAKEPAPITIDFGFEFTGSLSVKDHVAPSITIESNKVAPDPFFTIDGADGEPVELQVDDLLTQLKKSIGFDEYLFGGNFTTTTGGAHRINEKNIEALVEDGSVKQQLVQEIKKLIPVPSKAGQLLSDFTLKFKAADIALEYSLDLSKFLADEADSLLDITFEYEDYAEAEGDEGKILLIGGVLSKVTLWVKYGVT